MPAVGGLAGKGPYLVVYKTPDPRSRDLTLVDKRIVKFPINIISQRENHRECGFNLLRKLTPGKKLIFVWNSALPLIMHILSYAKFG